MRVGWIIISRVEMIISKNASTEWFQRRPRDQADCKGMHEEALYLENELDLRWIQIQNTSSMGSLRVKSFSLRH